MRRRHFLPALPAVALSGCATPKRPIAPGATASRARLVAARPLEYELAGSLRFADGTQWPFPRSGAVARERRS